MNGIPNGEKRFIYFYFNRNELERIRQVVPAHIQYWKTVGSRGHLGGPFGDRTGGLITLFVPSFEAASEIILRDPFVQEDLVEQKWIKGWLVE